MNIRVLFFAVLRERTGCEEQCCEMAEGQTVADLLRQLEQQHPPIQGLLPRLSVAVNREVTPHARVLHHNDEVALLPPVSGGSGARPIAVLNERLSLDEVVAAVMGPTQGGLVTFTGVVRNHGQQSEVIRLEYEAYIPMALKVMEEVAQEVRSEWVGTRVALHHRIGTLQVGEIAVVIAVSAPHRAEAFEGCRAVIDRLKQRVPIWKKEVGADGSEWVALGP